MTEEQQVPVSRLRTRAAANAFVLAALAAGAVAAVTSVALGTLRGDGVDHPMPRSGTVAAVATAPADGPQATRSAVATPPPAVTSTLPTEGRRLYGVEGSSVGEHPGLSSSPIATAAELIEPAGEFRRTVVPGTPLECDRFRPLVQQAGDWDPDVVLAFVWRESSCNERAVSATNDWGLMQLNATCWAGKGNFGLPWVRRLPSEIEDFDLHCDGTAAANPAAKWCYHAKEEARHGRRRPASPCDAWLDPATNLDTAHQIWRIKGWRPWCFDEVSQSTPACQAAAHANV